MQTIVMKFGGTSVQDLDRIRRVAFIVKEEYEKGSKIAVVVSAMAGETNRLVGLCNQVGPLVNPKEYDAVVSSGEQVTAGLLAMVLQAMSIPARSWQGWQLPIETTATHKGAHILHINPHGILSDFESNRTVAIVTGFQGITEGDRITTLGRGGSDTSAVALAKALEADCCDIYTDVEGVYTTDPRMVKKVQRIPKVSFEEMLEFSAQGAKVLHVRSVTLASQHRVPTRVLSTFNPSGEGTLLSDDLPVIEVRAITGIASSKDQARVTLRIKAEDNTITQKVFSALGVAGISVDMIIQIAEKGLEYSRLAFSLDESNLLAAEMLLLGLSEEKKLFDWEVEKDLVKISIIGQGMQSQSGVAQKMFEILSLIGAEVRMISTSEIKISVLINEDYLELAVRKVHAAFELDSPIE